MDFEISWNWDRLFRRGRRCAGLTHEAEDELKYVHTRRPTRCSDGSDSRARVRAKTYCHTVELGLFNASWHSSPRHAQQYTLSEYLPRQPDIRKPTPRRHERTAPTFGHKQIKAHTWESRGRLFSFGEADSVIQPSGGLRPGTESSDFSNPLRNRPPRCHRHDSTVALSSLESQTSMLHAAYTRLPVS